MKQGVLQWSPFTCTPSLSYLSLASHPFSVTFLSNSKPVSVISAGTLNSIEEEKLPARERRKLRNERRESKVFNWKEHVEERLIKKPKKRYASWTEELNLDNLADLGPQWWVVRVSRVNAQHTAEKLARSLARNYPDVEFKVYIPAVDEKRKLKNGTYSIKSKPLFPGCVFLNCILNKELHDFIRECDGVGGFVGSKVGNTIRQINKPRPVSEDDMEAIFKQAKEEQEKADLAFQQLQALSESEKNPSLDAHSSIEDVMEAVKPKRRSRASNKKNDKLPKPGSTVRVLSGSFAEFSGVLKKVDRKNGKAAVGFTLFGKETIADLDIDQVVAEIACRAVLSTLNAIETEQDPRIAYLVHQTSERGCSGGKKDFVSSLVCSSG